MEPEEEGKGNKRKIPFKMVNFSVVLDTESCLDNSISSKNQSASHMQFYNNCPVRCIWHTVVHTNAFLTLSGFRMC